MQTCRFERTFELPWTVLTESGYECKVIARAGAACLDGVRDRTVERFEGLTWAAQVEEFPLRGLAPIAVACGDVPEHAFSGSGCGDFHGLK